MKRSRIPQLPRLHPRVARLGTLILVAFAGPLFAQYAAAPGFESVDYTSDLVASHSLQRFALFLPDVPAPPAGYPVVISVTNPGFKDTNDCYDQDLTGFPEFQFLDAGFAVVQAAVTHTFIGEQTNACHDGELVLGNGLFHPPGVALSGLASSPYEDLSRPMAEKDVVMLVQHLRHNAGAMGLDASRIAYIGHSGSSVVGMWAILGPERGPGLFPGGTGQDAASSRVAAAILRSGSVHMPANHASNSGLHYPHKLAGYPWETGAGNLGQTFLSFMHESSALVYQDHALNQQQRIYMVYGTPSVSTDFEPQTPGGTDYIRGILDNVHSSWHGYAWKHLHPQTELVLTNPNAALFDEHGDPLYDELLEDQGLLTLGMIEYLRSELALFDPVTHVGPGTCAIAYNGLEITPVLTGTGVFDGIQGGRISVSQARYVAPLALVYGTSLLDLPLLGGNLGPSPQMVLVGYTTDAHKSFELDLPPQFAAPAGMTRYLQAWILDDRGPQGWTASNTIAVTGR